MHNYLIDLCKISSYCVLDMRDDNGNIKLPNRRKFHISISIHVSYELRFPDHVERPEVIGLQSSYLRDRVKVSLPFALASTNILKKNPSK